MEPVVVIGRNRVVAFFEDYNTDTSWDDFLISGLKRYIKHYKNSKYLIKPLIQLMEPGKSDCELTRETTLFVLNRDKEFKKIWFKEENTKINQTFSNIPPVKFPEGFIVCTTRYDQEIEISFQHKITYLCGCLTADPPILLSEEFQPTKYLEQFFEHREIYVVGNANYTDPQFFSFVEWIKDRFPTKHINQFFHYAAFLQSVATETENLVNNPYVNSAPYDSNVEVIFRSSSSSATPYSNEKAENNTSEKEISPRGNVVSEDSVTSTDSIDKEVISSIENLGYSDLVEFEGGGFGTVYCAKYRALNLEKEVILKCVEGKFKNSLKNEAGYQAIMKHKYILPIDHYFEASYEISINGKPIKKNFSWLAMDKLHFTLNTILHTFKELYSYNLLSPDVMERLDIVAITYKVIRQLLKALQFVHSTSHLHNDIHPGNIGINIVNYEGQTVEFLFQNPKLLSHLTVKLFDFGLASKENSVLYGKHKKYSSPEYLEVLKNEKKHTQELTLRSDIYMVGKVMKFCIKSKSNSTKNTRELFPQSFLNIAEKASQPDKDKRYQDSVSMMNDLQEAYFEYLTKKNRKYLPPWFQWPVIKASCTGGFEPTKIECEWELTISRENPQLLFLNAPFLPDEFQTFFEKRYHKKCDTILNEEMKYNDYIDTAYPLEYKTLYEQGLEKFYQQKKIGNAHESTVLALKKHQPFLVDESEKGLRLTMSLSKYSHSRGIFNIWSNLTNEQKKKKIQNKNIYSATMGTHTAVITFDSKILFLMRTKNVLHSPFTITCGPVETMKYPDDVHFPERIPDPFLCIARSLNEEIGLVEFWQDENLPNNLRQYIKVTGLIEKEKDMQRGLVAYVDLRDMPISSGLQLTADEIKPRWEMNLGKDCKTETREIHFIDFNPKSVVQWIIKQEGRVTNSAVACALLCLRSLHTDSDSVFIKELHSYRDMIDQIQLTSTPQSYTRRKREEIILPPEKKIKN